MGAEMQHRMGGELLPDPAIERGEGMGRRKIALEQQPHRVALISEGRLQPHKHIAELLAQHKDAAAIALLPPRCGPPMLFDLAQPFLAADMRVRADPHGDVGIRAMECRIALDDRAAQIIDAFWHLDAIPCGRERMQRVEQGVEHREIGRRADGAGIGQGN